MLEVTVQDTRNGGGERLIADQVIWSDTPALRRKGLLGRQSLDPSEGALLDNPHRLGLSLFHSIHMFGVPFDLAAAWLDEAGAILDAKRARPGRMVFPSGFFTESRYILEVHPDHLPLLRERNRVRWREGDQCDLVIQLFTQCSRHYLLMGKYRKQKLTNYPFIKQHPQATASVVFCESL